MAYAYQGVGALDYFPCRYGKSKLLFRGPYRPPGRRYVAVLGGTETYGKFVPFPYPDLVEKAIGVRVINLGCMNAGPDAFLREPAVLELTSEALVTIVQIMGAQNLTNRFYSVHPRRNDRFVRASPLLLSLYQEVDFTEFHFTRHMLRTLQGVSAQKFDAVAEELRIAWVARMKGLLDGIPGRTLLLWMADHVPLETGNVVDMTREPLLIDQAMITAVRPHATEYVEVVSSPGVLLAGATGMAFSPLEEPAAQGLPGPAVHGEVAARLAPVLEQML